MTPEEETQVEALRFRLKEAQEKTARLRKEARQMRASFHEVRATPLQVFRRVK